MKPMRSTGGQFGRTSGARRGHARRRRSVPHVGSGVFMMPPFSPCVTGEWRLDKIPELNKAQPICDRGSARGCCVEATETRGRQTAPIYMATSSPASRPRVVVSAWSALSEKRSILSLKSIDMRFLGRILEVLGTSRFRLGATWQRGRGTKPSRH